jgi:GNAT superfamily N-acetyltransferase
MTPYEISSDTTRLDLGAVHDFLARSYWAESIPLPTLTQAVRNSMWVGAFHGMDQVGFARVITDKATFAYLADVYVLENHRGQGLARRMLDTLFALPDLQHLRRILLATRDAHGLYAQFGFKPLASSARFMERHDPDVYRN